MNYDRDDDQTWEYEMIWTLFQGSGKEEEEVPKSSKEGVTVKLLKFLFGSGEDKAKPSTSPQVPPRDPPPHEYRGEKKRFHRHVYEPSPRQHPGASPPLSDVNGGHDRTKKMLGGPDMGPAAPNMPATFYTNLCGLVVAMTVATVLMLLSSATRCIDVIKSLMHRGEGLENLDEV